MAHPAYRARHQAVRAALLAVLAEAGAWPCPRCGKPMIAGMDLDLGHSDGAAKAAGLPGERLEHASCNRRAGQKLGAASPLRKLPRKQPRQPRIWLFTAALRCCCLISGVYGTMIHVDDCCPSCRTRPGRS